MLQYLYNNAGRKIEFIEDLVGSAGVMLNSDSFDQKYFDETTEYLRNKWNKLCKVEFYDYLLEEAFDEFIGIESFDSKETIDEKCQTVFSILCSEPEEIEEYVSNWEEIMSNSQYN